METPAVKGRFGKAKERSAAKILRFPGLPSKPCAICGAQFRPVQQWHQLCRQCWTFNCLGQAVVRFNAGMRS